MATTKHEPIDKEVSVICKDGKKRSGRIWRVEIDITSFGSVLVYSVSYLMFGNEMIVRCDEEFNEIID